MFLSCGVLPSSAVPSIHRPHIFFSVTIPIVTIALGATRAGSWVLLRGGTSVDSGTLNGGLVARE